MTSQSGDFALDSGVSSFVIPLNPAFADIPSTAFVFVNPPAGQPAIGVRRITRAADSLTVEIDTVTPAAGYSANWFAALLV